ncbi:MULTISPECIES: hypothetical protein [Streptomyces]|uniref:hypothetical protein n=1 Tax=Streptomyces TaxID=1883 RepID=UPI00341D0315
MARQDLVSRTTSPEPPPDRTSIRAPVVGSVKLWPGAYAARSKAVQPAGVPGEVGEREEAAVALAERLPRRGVTT